VNDNLPSRTRNHAQFVSEVTDSVTAVLSEYGVFYPPTEAIGTIIKFTLHHAQENRMTVDAYINSLESVDGIVEEIRNELLLEIAEERPGTNPWEHEGNIPVPVPVVTMTIHAVSMCANLAYAENASAWAQQALDIIGQMSAASSEWMLTNNLEIRDINILLSGGTRTFPGPVVYLPQSGVACTARFFEAVASRISSGLWTISDEDTDGVTAEATAANLRHEAAMLRNLNVQFGHKVGPTRQS
jgi:hypothetical protein